MLVCELKFLYINQNLIWHYLFPSAIANFPPVIDNAILEIRLESTCRCCEAFEAFEERINYTCC